MPLQVPAFPTYHQHEMFISLDETIYLIRMTWRERTASWYLDMSLEDGTELIRGRRLTPGWGPLLGMMIDSPPNGLFWVLSPDDFEREDLGEVLRLLFMTAEELAVEETVDDDAPIYEVV